jgi:hypothetical protein
MREGLPIKERKMYNGTKGKMVAYFSGKRFVDFLMESKYSTEQDEEAPVETREDAMQIARMLMDRENFFCAEFALKKIKKVDGTIKERKIVKALRGGYARHFFVDDDVPFVWTYDPVTKKTLMYGLMLLGGVAACAALPLWPMWLRNIVIGFLLFILVGRPGIWLVVWLATFSRWNFWILPNLDEDIAFDKRFKPVFLLEKSETASGGNDEGDDDGEGDGDGDGDNDDDGDGEEAGEDDGDDS